MHARASPRAPRCRPGDRLDHPRCPQPWRQRHHAACAPIEGCCSHHTQGKLTTRASAAAAAPCVVITAPDGHSNSSLQLLAASVRRLGCAALVIAPEAAAAAANGPQPATEPAGLTFEQELPLTQNADHELTFSVRGASAADCVQVAVDQSCGLLTMLALSPVLVLVGVARGPALSSGMEQHPAVAVACQAAVLGLPAVAVCLATTTAGAPLQPAVDATAELLSRVLPMLQQHAGRSWPSPANFPRAHFPFPTQGRWSIGAQLPLPRSASARQGEQSFDCWALGDDNSWLGSGSSRSNERLGSLRQQQQGADTQAYQYQLLQAAFAEGDALLCVNVAPTWSPASGFAATRPGVLWRCHQVVAHHDYQQQQQRGSSWRVDGGDLFGRTLPSSGYGSAVPVGSNFVQQDNTRKVVRERNTWREAQAPGPAAASQLPAAFTIRRGTTLNDAAACGDVEAALAGKAAVTLVQAWPAGHPLSCRDELLHAALDEAPDGLPAWLGSCNDA